ncbi:hypothetical protein ILFOPFJJ_01123 [Ensifer psoraleae]|nr:hypothetical protein [Sinorhizobium psoraleae]
MSASFDFSGLGLPLTLALSPLAGRGDASFAACSLIRERDDGAAGMSLLPVLRAEGAGRRMRGERFERRPRHG